MKTTKAGPDKHKPCRECPFSRTGPAGWLGGYADADQLADLVLGETRLPCHMAIDYDADDVEEQEMAAPTCRGALAFMNHMCKRSRNPAICREQDEVGDRPDVFKSRAELASHHEKPPRRGA